jgi:hypothetical protein
VNGYVAGGCVAVGGVVGGVVDGVVEGGGVRSRKEMDVVSVGVYVVVGGE